MHIIADIAEQFRDRIWRHLRPIAFDQHQLRPAGVETGRAAFINLDMRFAVTDDALMRLAQ